MSEYETHILLVDDEPHNLEIVCEYLNEFNYRISMAKDGAIAWQMLEDEPENYDVILLDRMMPNMNGMEVMAKIQQHPIVKYCPVILQTAKAGKEDIYEGLQSGAHYYITKPFEKEMLFSVVKTAIRDRQLFKTLHDIMDKSNQTLGLMESAIFKFQSLEEAHNLATLLANTSRNPSKVVMGLGELMINAVEHGNLDIGYEQKTLLNKENKWNDEIKQRLQADENKNKYAEVRFKHNGSKIEITISDEGKGFDWKKYLEFDPDRVMDNHGRGIAMANNVSFCRLEYLDKGNVVRVHVET